MELLGEKVHKDVKVEAGSGTVAEWSQEWCSEPQKPRSNGMERSICCCGASHVLWEVNYRKARDQLQGTDWVKPGEVGKFYSVPSRFSCVRLFETPWTVACQAPLFMGFPTQEYWSGLPFPSPEDLPNPGTEPRSHVSCICRWVLYHYHHLVSPWKML